MNDNLNNIHELNYIIVPNTENSNEFITNNIALINDDKLRSNIKISNIEQKEYMINISTFRTFVNPENEIFYTQNTFYNSKLEPYVHEKIENRKRWGLHNTFLRHKI